MKFTFVVITYNHEKYIIEHLESIKYLITNYGKNIEFNLIICDDASRDRTLNFAKHWLEINSGLFASHLVLDEKENKGTCNNFTKCWKYIDADYCKITAGDDVYSSINIFNYLDYLDDCDIVSGVPLFLIDNRLKWNKSQIFHIIATDIIYSKKNYIERMKSISVANTPNIIFPVKVAKNSVIQNFVQEFHVTEDYPLHIKMSEVYNPLKNVLLPIVFVYYRRTSNSTYLIKTKAFDQDKLKIFNYLINAEKNIVKRFLLQNRKFCYKSNNRFLSICLNINYYIYLFSIIIRFTQIAKSYSKVKINYIEYNNHMSSIQENAKQFLLTVDS